MNKKISLGMTISLIIISITATFFITVAITKSRLNSQLSGLSEKSAMFEKLSEVDSRVRYDGLFSGDIDEDKLVDNTVKGYVSGLNDEYAGYYSKEDYQKVLDADDGQGQGIGLSVVLDKDEITVTSVVNGSPAKTAGIKAQDKIIAVNGSTVAAIGVDKAYNILKGENGDKLSLTLERQGQKLSVSLEISDYEIISVTQDLYGTVGVIKISQFNGNTPDQFKTAIENLQEQNISSYIFDVRNNPGGMLSAVCDVLDMICPSGTLVTAKYANGEEKTLYSSDANEIKGEMVVLVNENSASAAELFAAVMRDYGKAKIVGTQTYGKGVAQTTQKLFDGSALKLTTFYFNPPKTENFNGVGLTPDVIAPLTDNTQNIDLLSLEEDEQIQTAVKILNGD